MVDKSVTFSAAAADGHCFCWSRCPFAVISDSGRYFEINLSVSPGHVEKDTSPYERMTPFPNGLLSRKQNLYSPYGIHTSNGLFT